MTEGPVRLGRQLAAALLAVGIMTGAFLSLLAWWLPFTVCVGLWLFARRAYAGRPNG